MPEFIEEECVFEMALFDIQKLGLEVARLRGLLGITISAIRLMEEATGETFDDEGGDIAAIEAEFGKPADQS